MWVPRSWANKWRVLCHAMLPGRALLSGLIALVFLGGPLAQAQSLVTPSVDAHAFADNGAGSSTVSAPGVSTTAANELLLAFIATDYASGANTTVTGVTGGGLTWSLVKRTNVQSGTSEIWGAFAPATLSNVTVTATLSQSVASSIYVASFNGVDPTGTGGAGAIGATASANSPGGAPRGSLVTTRANSLVLAVGNDYDNAIARTPGAGQAVVHQYLTPQGDTYWVQQLNAPVPAAGVTATINDTAPTTDRYNLTLVEVRPPAGPTYYSITGSLAPTPLAANSTVNLSGGATSTTTADTSGNFSFGGLPNGSYTVTPSKTGVAFSPSSQTVVINGKAVTGVSFTATSTGSTVVAVDAKASADTFGASNTVSSPVFSTTAGNELLLALVSTDYVSGANTTVTAVSGGGLTWTLVARANGQIGTSEIWRAFAPAALSSQMVTATLSQSVVASLTVMSFTGVDPTGTNGANAIGATATPSSPSGAPSASLVTTRNGSLVIGVGNDYDNAISRTVGTGQTLVHQYLTALGDTYWVQMRSAVTSAAGTTVTINDTAPTGDQYNLAIAEIRGPTPRSTLYSISGTISPASSGAGAVVTLSGAATATTAADAAGDYSFTGLAPGAYTLAPSGPAATFTPSSLSVTIANSNVSSVNFTATSNGIFFDDFAGTALGPAWTVISRHGEYAQNETECNIPQQVFVANSLLTITTAVGPATCGDFNIDGSARHAPASWPYVTGDVQWRSLSFTYGTVTVRAKFPAKATGLWPAIWLMGANCQNTNPFTADIGYSTCPNFGPTYEEIDMVECDLNNWCQLAMWTGGNLPTCGFNIDPLDSKWHIFSLTWTATSVTETIDGVDSGCRYTSSGAVSIPSAPMFLIIQTQTGGVGGAPDDSLLPASFQIDFVKVTQP